MKLPPITEKFDHGVSGFLLAHLVFFLFIQWQHWSYLRLNLEYVDIIRYSWVRTLSMVG